MPITLKSVLRAVGLDVARARPPERRLILTRGTAARLLYFWRRFEQIRDVPGDIIECGVGKAKTFQLLALLTYLEGRGRTLWGFDSFAGYPEPTPEDESPRRRRKGEWRVMGAEAVRPLLEAIGLPPEFVRERVRVVPGFFEDTLPSSGAGPIALLHLDVNLYRSYRICLEELFPHVSPGGAVLFDEYAREQDLVKCPGAKRAIDEYFAGTPYAIKRDPLYPRYYLLKAG